jgi:predicted Zn-dependent peptidase
MARRLAVLFTLLAATAVGAADKPVPLPKDLPPYGEDRPLPVPALDQSRLPGGLTIWLVKRPGVPRLTAVLATRGGTAADPSGREGVAQVLADTIKEGTTTRTSKRIAEELQSVGGEIASSASDDAIFLTVDGLSSGAATLMEILADVAQHASFPPAEVELAKNNAIQGLLAREATPEFLAEKAFARAVYGDHPYRVVAPTRETLGMVSPELLKGEFSRRFRPERSLLVVVGDLNPAALSPLLARSFAGGKGAGEAPPATPPSPGAGGRRIYVVSRPGSVQSLILAGRPTVTATDPEYYPLLVANTIFSGAFSSRLVRNIREDKGYTYSPRGAVVAREQGGLLRVRADVRNEVTGASTLEIFYELDRMGATSPTPDELSRAKRYQAGLYLLRNQIQGTVARTLATNWVNGLPPQALGEFVTRINAVSAEQVKKVGQTFYPSATQTVVVVGDEAKIKAEMAQFGALTTVQP